MIRCGLSVPSQKPGDFVVVSQTANKPNVVAGIFCMNVFCP